MNVYIDGDGHVPPCRKARFENPYGLSSARRTRINRNASPRVGTGVCELLAKSIFADGRFASSPRFFLKYLSREG